MFSTELFKYRFLLDSSVFYEFHPIPVRRVSFILKKTTSINKNAFVRAISITQNGNY